MAMEVLLSFDGSLAFAELVKAFETVVQSLSNTVLENARSIVGADYPEVASTLQARLLSLATSGIVDGQIGSDHWKAWMAEWGSGSLLDPMNPDLAAYMQSELWNPLRQSDYDITGRPQGTYLGLDGLMHETSGRLAGRSLEDMVQNVPAFKAWADANVGPDAFMPKPPLHFMREALESNRNLIMDQLNAVLETFRFGDFFV